MPSVRLKIGCEIKVNCVMFVGMLSKGLFTARESEKDQEQFKKIKG